MELQNVRYEIDESVAVLTIDRPQVLNALDATTVRELLDCVAEIERSGSVRCVTLTGAGDKAFCAGADIAAMRDMTAVQGRDWARLGQRLTSAIEELPVPVLAAVNGFALGGGLELAMACDWILASERARLGQPEINLGAIPGFGGTQRLARRIGAPRAREMIYGGDVIDAETARQWGLVNRVLKHEELVAETRALARKLAAQAPLAIAQAKRAIRLGLDVDLESGLRYEAEAFAVSFATDDRKEGMTAFLEKRKPSFRGR